MRKEIGSGSSKTSDRARGIGSITSRWRDAHFHFEGGWVHNKALQIGRLGMLATKLLGHRADHIFNNHLFGAGQPGKTEFPARWDREKIVECVTDIVMDPASLHRRGNFGQDVIIGERDGVDIVVDMYPPGSK